MSSSSQIPGHGILFVLSAHCQVLTLSAVALHNPALFAAFIFTAWWILSTYLALFFVHFYVELKAAAVFVNSLAHTN